KLRQLGAIGSWSVPPCWPSLSLCCSRLCSRFGWSCGCFRCLALSSLRPPKRVSLESAKRALSSAKLPSKVSIIVRYRRYRTMLGGRTLTPRSRPQVLRSMQITVYLNDLAPLLCPALSYDKASFPPLVLLHRRHHPG